MRTYPPDIMAAAEQALDRLLCNCAESCGGPAGVRAASISDIAAAIAAEREACAKIAQDHLMRIGPDGYSEHGSQCAACGCHEAIANAISNRSK